MPRSVRCLGWTTWRRPPARASRRCGSRGRHRLPGNHERQRTASDHAGIPRASTQGRRLRIERAKHFQRQRRTIEVHPRDAVREILIGISVGEIGQRTGRLRGRLGAGRSDAGLVRGGRRARGGLARLGCLGVADDSFGGGEEWHVGDTSGYSLGRRAPGFSGFLERDLWRDAHHELRARATRIPPNIQGAGRDSSDLSLHAPATTPPASPAP